MSSTFLALSRVNSLTGEKRIALVNLPGELDRFLLYVLFVHACVFSRQEEK